MNCGADLDDKTVTIIINGEEKPVSIGRTKPAHLLETPESEKTTRDETAEAKHLQALAQGATFLNIAHNFRHFFKIP